LESGELSLEESLAIFERGQKLAAYCNNLLEQAALKVEQLTSDGEIINISPPPAG
jgi:exodeoxyribonuclease VII small subunit